MSKLRVRLISAKEASVYLGISPKTFWEWVNKGVVPQVKIPGTNPKYDIRDIDLLIDRNKKFIDSFEAEKKVLSLVNSNHNVM